MGDVKILYRKAPVPIIPQLAAILDAYWIGSGKPAKGWVWPVSRGKLPWHGRHAFRRGLASNLSALGVPDNVIQQILRHGDLATTQRFYRKTRRPAVKKAMQKLSRKLVTTDSQI